MALYQKVFINVGTRFWEQADDLLYASETMGHFPFFKVVDASNYH